jgi:tetratricopeptide (TPR) repeat protein
MSIGRVRGSLGLGLWFGVAMLAAPSTGFAQGQRDREAADRIFAEAMKLLKSEDWARACPKFEESMKLDPSTGTKINIAKCHERSGKLETALQDCEEAQRLNEKDTNLAQKQRRHKLIEDELARLKRRMNDVRKAHRLLVEGADLLDLGNEAACSKLEESMMLDPSPETLLDIAKCHQHFEKLKLARQNHEEARRLNENDTDVTPKQRHAKLVEDGLAELPERRRVDITKPPPDGKEQRISGVVVGSFGVASLAVAVGLASMAYSKVGQSSSYCTADLDIRCTQQGLDLRSDAHRALAGAYTFMGAGVALVTVGAVLFAKAPKTRSEPGAAELAVTASPRDVSLRWRF